MKTAADVTNSALRCTVSYLLDAAECIGAAGRFTDIAEDVLGQRQRLSELYAEVASLAQAVRHRLNLAEDPPTTRESCSHNLYSCGCSEGPNRAQ